jgi:hypothetical protein
MSTSSKESAAIRLDLEGPIFESIENWRRSHSKIPSRADAVRQLLEQALSGQAGNTAPAS